MKITLYGKLADLLGRQIDLQIESGCTVGTIRSHLIAAFPKAAASLGDGRVRACIGSALVSDDHPVTGADEIEFLAPVSGG